MSLRIVPSSEIINDVSVQVRHDHYIELFWLANELHASVVDDHRFELDLGVALRDLNNWMRLGETELEEG